MLSEHDIILKLKQAFGNDHPAIVGIGDDAAIIPLNSTQSTLISKDLLCEDIHFKRRYFDPKSLAHKALHVNLSDIAAMGGHAKFALLGLAIPANLSSSWINDFLDSFILCCKAQGILLIGGDTTASTGALTISITIMGQSDNAHIKRRSSAKPGDLLCVVGTLGESHAGLFAMEKNSADLSLIKNRFLRPEAKVLEGAWLGQHPQVNAMMDISDGLYIDLSRLCKASGVGADIELSSLKPTDELQKAAQYLNINPNECMLIGGEDYALLFSVNKDHFSSIQHSFEKAFTTPLAMIGEITALNKITLKQHGLPVPFTYQPFSHFGEPD